MEYQLAVKTAEDAVASMKDAKLREIAFAQILAKLLTGDKQSSGHSSAPERKSHAARKGTGGRQGGVLAWLRELVTEGFFKNPRSMKVIRERLAEQSHHLAASDLTKQLQMLCHEKVLRRKKMAPTEGKAGIWHWSNW